MYDDFESGTYSFTEGGTSPNNKWVNSFRSGGTSGVRLASSGTDLTNVMWSQPQAAASAGQTFSVLNYTSSPFYDFDLNFDMRTISQLRTGSAPNNWETAWIQMRGHEGGDSYYFVIKMSGCEFGKVQGPTQYILVTPLSPSVTLGTWNHVRIKAVGIHFLIWVDGSLVIDFIDEGNVGFPAPPPPSPLEYYGKIGTYCEDAQVEFDNVAIDWATSFRYFGGKQQICSVGAQTPIFG
jgi:hypothetical protein